MFRVGTTFLLFIQRLTALSSEILCCLSREMFLRSCISLVMSCLKTHTNLTMLEQLFISLNTLQTVVEIKKSILRHFVKLKTFIKIIPSLIHYQYMFFTAQVQNRRIRTLVSRVQYVPPRVHDVFCPTLSHNASYWQTTETKITKLMLAWKKQLRNHHQTKPVL